MFAAWCGSHLQRAFQEKAEGHKMASRYQPQLVQPHGEREVLKPQPNLAGGRAAPDEPLEGEKEREEKKKPWRVPQRSPFFSLSLLSKLCVLLLFLLSVFVWLFCVCVCVVCVC
eukprot:Sspe_Gene.18625::Locus_6711_Transcript_1_1_Confidence_1.000_Length_563::g.18625::m.18625